MKNKKSKACMHTELVRYCKRECPRQVPEPAALTGNGLSCPDAQGLLPAPPRTRNPPQADHPGARQQSLCVPPQPRTRNPGRRLRPDSALSPRALRPGLPSRRQGAHRARPAEPASRRPPGAPGRASASGPALGPPPAPAEGKLVTHNLSGEGGGRGRSPAPGGGAGWGAAPSRGTGLGAGRWAAAR